MYNEQLENLITMALMDGELTEKEKQILFKKAEAFGVDLDEFEMVLEAKLFEKKKQTQQVTAAPKSDKLGDIKKCPACGAIAETFATRCKECGTEFRNIEASKNIVKFFEKLDDIESQRKDTFSEVEKGGSGFSFGILIKWWIFWWILIPLKLLTFIINKSKSAKWSTTDFRKSEIIMNFPVPNSKEEIIEFLTLSTSRIDEISYLKALSDESKYKNAWNKIWLKKIIQIDSKAAFSMKADVKAYDEIKKIVNNAKSQVKTNQKRAIHILIAFLIITVSLVSWAVIAKNISDGKEEAQKVIQQDFITNAQDYVKTGEYDKAMDILPNINNVTEVVKIKCLIQLETLTASLDDLKLIIDAKEHTKAKNELNTILWEKVSETYSTESIERDYFEKFLLRKEGINKQLPEKYRVELRTKYDL